MAGGAKLHLSPETRALVRSAARCSHKGSTGLVARIGVRKTLPSRPLSAVRGGGRNRAQRLQSSVCVKDAAPRQ
jgi:hypothetical protein